MSTAPTALSAPVPRRMYRPEYGRVFVGVAAGLAENLRVPVKWVRWAFVLGTVLSGGAGIPAYLMLWVFTPAGYLVDPRTGAAIAGEPSSVASRMFQGDPARRALFVGGGLLVVGLPLAVTGFGIVLPVSPATLLALAAVLGGAIIAWSHLDSEERRQWLGVGDGHNKAGIARVLIGAALAVVGAIVLVTRGSGTAILWDVLVATIAVLAGLVLVLLPWGLRFYRRLQAEQATRIRETERADIAAHLHDSVLQTLALIQRTDDPGRVAQLARAQERELRSWLYGAGKSATDSLAAAVTDAASEVEDMHGVPIDLVVTGDRPTGTRAPRPWSARCGRRC